MEAPPKKEIAIVVAGVALGGYLTHLVLKPFQQPDELQT